MTIAARYALIRLLPDIEADEAVNVGVVMVAPEARFFDYRLTTRWRRIGQFFAGLDRAAVRLGRETLAAELERRRELFTTNLGAGDRGAAAALFDDLVATREGFYRFGLPRALLAKDPGEALDAVFARLVDAGRAAAVQDEDEQLVTREVRETLRRSRLRDRYVEARLGDTGFQFIIPFAALDHRGYCVRAIRPLNLAYADPVRILDHGNEWAGRLRHLDRIGRRPPAFLFPVREPTQGEGAQRQAFEEARGALADTGALVLGIRDMAGITAFARELPAAA